MAVTALECPGCGAKLSASAGQQTITCEYCSTTCQVQQPHAGGASPWGQHHHAQAAQAAEMGRRAQKIVLWSTLGTTVLGIGIAGIRSLVRHNPSSHVVTSVPRDGRYFHKLQSCISMLCCICESKRNLR